jgi:hypothetical protein
MRDLLYFCLYFVLGATLLLGGTAYLLFGWEAMERLFLPALAIYAALMLAGGMLKACSDLCGWFSRAIVARDGWIEVRTKGGRLICQSPLKASRWYSATREAAQVQEELWLRAERGQLLVFLVLPLRVIGIEIWRRHVPCGFTDESYRRWEAFLRLSKVRRGRPPWVVRLSRWLDSRKSAGD